MPLFHMLAAEFEAACPGGCPAVPGVISSRRPAKVPIETCHSRGTPNNVTRPPLLDLLLDGLRHHPGKPAHV